MKTITCKGCSKKKQVQDYINTEYCSYKHYRDDNPVVI